MKNALITALIVLASIVGAEFIARAALWQPAPEADIGHIRYGYSPGTLGDLHPGQDGVYITDRQTRFHPFHVATNAEGFRNRREIDPQGWRILALGDSTTFGLYANSQDVWTDWLEHHLRQAGLDTQVLNAAMPGSSIADQLEYWHDKGGRLGAKLVILCAHNNDLVEVLRPRSARQNGLESARSVDMAELRWLLGHNSALYNGAHAIKDKVMRSDIKAENREAAAQAAADPAALGSATIPPESFARYEALFQRFAAEVKAADAHLLLAFLPGEADGVSALTPFFQGLAERNGATFVDLGQAIGSLAYEEIWLTRLNDPDYPVDGHLSRVGNMRVAHTMAEALIAAKLLLSVPTSVR